MQFAVVDDMTTNFAKIYADAHAAIAHSQELFTRHANKYKKPFDFNIGDYVMLYIKKLHIKCVDSNPFVKLAPRFYGPLRSLKRLMTLHIVLTCLIFHTFIIFSQ